MSDTRLTEIETRLAYAEYTVAELSDLVYAQSQSIDRLAEQCRRLEHRVAAQADSDPDDQATPQDEVPPHY